MLHKTKINGTTSTERLEVSIQYIPYRIKTKKGYKGENIDFSSGTVVYLPKEKSEDIDYTTVTAEEGTGVCIFFSIVH